MYIPKSLIWIRKSTAKLKIFKSLKLKSLFIIFWIINWEIIINIIPNVLSGLAMACTW